MEEQEIMANVELNTKLVRTCGEDIVALADEYEEIIETIFTHISNLNVREDGWQGEDAELYIDSVMKDKEIYLNLYEKLKRFGLVYQEAAERFETSLRKVDINQ